MTRPLALLCYENLLPGSQLVNRLRDLGYRVECIEAAHDLPHRAQEERPLVVFMDLESEAHNMIAVLQALRATPATAHIPVIAFCETRQRRLQSEAAKVGATLIVASDGILDQLSVLLEQALEIE